MPSLTWWAIASVRTAMALRLLSVAMWLGVIDDGDNGMPGDTLLRLPEL